MIGRLRVQASVLVTAFFGKSSDNRAANRGQQQATAFCGATCDAGGGQAGSPPTSGSFLASQAVTPAVQDAYRRVVVTFLMFCATLGFTLGSIKEIEFAMCRYFDEAYWEEVGPSMGETFLSAWVHCFPEYRPGDFPLALRALRGWRRLRPAFGRHPLPWIVCCAVAAFLAFSFGPGFAVAVLVMFDGYLRPYEVMGIRLRDVYLPTPEFACVSIQICPWAAQRPSKTGVFDDTVRLDSRSRPEVALLLVWWVQCRRQAGADNDDFLFTMDQAELSKAFVKAIEWLWLSPWRFVLYSNRHGGPSADRGDGSRSPEEIQRRGRWASERSVRRYEQTGRLHAVIASLPATVQDFCRRAAAHLLELIISPRALRRPEPGCCQPPPPPPAED